MERARDLLNRPSHPKALDGRSHRALFGAILSFVFAIISVGLHDAMIALISDQGFQYSEASGLTAGIRVTAE